MTQHHLDETRSAKRGTVVLTGATGGIGAQIARETTDAGYDLQIVGSRAGRLEVLASELRSRSGATVSCHTVNLAKRDEVEAYCAHVQPPLYGLINGAAVVHPNDDRLSTWHQVLDVNLTAPYILVNALKSKIANGGRIINISSQLGRAGRMGYGAYCASKFGLIGLTKCWAKELGPRQITVNAVCPSWVSTPQAAEDNRRLIGAGQLPETFEASLELNRMTTPSEVADLVCFLLSERGRGVSGRDWLLTSITDGV